MLLRQRPKNIYLVLGTKATELLQILEEMVELQRGVRVTPEQHEHLATAVRLMATAPVRNRSLFAFYELLQDDQEGSLRPAISMICRPTSRVNSWMSRPPIAPG